jgi:hypothetical protein
MPAVSAERKFLPGEGPHCASEKSADKWATPLEYRGAGINMFSIGRLTRPIHTSLQRVQ